MATRTLQRSFGGGEVTGEFWGQVADAKYQMGLALCRNFILLPHGPAANRAGTAYVNTAKLAGRTCRLLAFTYSTTQTMVMEFGHQYIRFHTQGATLLSGGVPYEVVTPYQEADLFALHTTQSADVFTIVHPNYPPMELRRIGATNWTLTTIVFGSTLSPPTAVTATATGTGATTYSYVVASVGSNAIGQSLQSAAASCTNNLLTTGNFNTIGWTAATGASRYYVYKQSNGLYGYIGQTDGTSFVDDNITADIANTPPTVSNPFAASGDYPGAVGYFEQRRWFAGTINLPQTFWATRSGTESDLSYSIPTRDDDALTFRVAAREANTIHHIVPLSNLLLMTSASEWRLTSVNTDAITPSSVSVRPQAYIGANNAQPVVVNNNVLYVAARGAHAREMAYSFNASGYVTGDLSLRAPHLFDTFDVTDLCYVKAPYPIVWAVSTSGKLLGLTYVPEQQIGAWHQHDTDGVFESCTAVAEGTEDHLYVVVRRVVNGSTLRYIERMASRNISSQADSFFVDAGATYSGAPITSISGLTWLEGKTVSILGDGAVRPQQVVTGGTVALDAPASVVQVGLPITADLQTLPASFLQMEAAGQGHTKNVNKIWLRIFKSLGIFAGPDFNHLREYKQRTIEPYGVAPALKTDEIEISLDPTWGASGQVCIRQTNPLPLTITSLSAEIVMGG